MCISSDSGRREVSMTRMGILVLQAILLLLAGCDDSSYVDAPLPDSVTGRVTVATAELDATIQNIDPSRQTIGLLCQDGTVKTFRMKPELAAMSGYKVGDHVIATVIDEVAIYVSKADTGPSAAGSQAVGVMTDGAVSDTVMADTIEMTARVVAIDTGDRTIRLEGTDGEVHTFPVSEAVDLAAINPGDDVVVRHTEAIAVIVEQP
jgi:hypothetical protein